MINYITKFSSRLSDLAEPIRELVKDKELFYWGPEHQQTFIHMEEEITSACFLTYYNTKKQTTLQTDISIKGLGVHLHQDSKPVYFASKSLTLERLCCNWVGITCSFFGQWRSSTIFVMSFIFCLKQIKNCLKPYYPKVLINIHQIAGNTY